MDSKKDARSVNRSDERMDGQSVAQPLHLMILMSITPRDIPGNGKNGNYKKAILDTLVTVRVTVEFVYLDEGFFFG